ncbi:hypothetical protein BC826DRAFT_1110719 [Russula brevipes]|nr:hypothetical protein BC826DRAFT_1110719 [Russula brevipes]
MSNIPTPQQHPPTPQRIAGSLVSIISAVQELLSSAPDTALELRPTFLQFYAHPISALILGLPSHSTPQTSLPNQQQFDKITNTLSTLMKTVEGLRAPPAAKPQKHDSPPMPTKATPAGTGKHSAPMPTYAAKAAVQVRPSLVYSPATSIHSDARPKPSEICHLLNAGLLKTQYAQVQIAAARWTAKGNLVLTAGHNTTQPQLQFSSALIKKFLNDFLSNTAPTTIRANVRWSKILLNSVPTGAAEGRVPHTPSQCHAALQATNPLYAQLSVTQLPSWVRAPNNFAPHSHSSLVFSFEDPDGTQEKALMAIRQLYIFGTVATTKKWKNTPPKAKTPPKPTTADETQQQGAQDPHTAADSKPTSHTPPQKDTSKVAPPTMLTRQGRSKRAAQA